MPIIPWRPFWDMERWFDEDWPDIWERPLRFPALRTPRMNISETEKEVVAEIELPGVDPKNIEVEVKDNILKVQAKKKEKKEEKRKGYYRREISAGFYKRAIPLPVEVKGEKADATYEDGMLKIIIPKVRTTKKVKKGVKVKEKKTN
jgi:HSP20 family protein